MKVSLNTVYMVLIWNNLDRIHRDKQYFDLFENFTEVMMVDIDMMIFLRKLHYYIYVFLHKRFGFYIKILVILKFTINLNQ
jgi:hypothetical protein